jgi:hypothetical protein
MRANHNGSKDALQQFINATVGAIDKKRDQRQWVQLLDLCTNVLADDPILPSEEESKATVSPINILCNYMQDSN